MHFGRRGPSGGITHQIPEGTTVVDYFYSELTVPKGSDIIGGYWNANGFNNGYFGLQVNGPTDRRIIFSIWSPAKTDIPSEVPEEDRVLLLRKGADDVLVKEFGGEGSGGHSNWPYAWKTDTTYGFLVKGETSTVAAGNTEYTGWFKDADTWHLITSWSRPRSEPNLGKRYYSFLENFREETGDQGPRTGYYGN